MSKRQVIVLYVISTLCAAFTAVLAAFAFPITLTLADPGETEAIPSDIGEVLMTLLNNMVANPVDALVNANYLGILVWAIVLGIAMRYTSEATRDFFSNISHAISAIVRWVIACAPFGILGLIYTSVSENGPEIFIEYGQLLAVLLGCMVFVACLLYTSLAEEKKEPIRPKHHITKRITVLKLLPIGQQATISTSKQF